MTTQLVYVNDCTAHNIPFNAYLELVASTPVSVNTLQFSFLAGTGRMISLAIGPVGQEQDVLLALNFPADQIQYSIPAGTRLSVKCQETTAVTSGFLGLTLFPVAPWPLPDFTA